MQSAASSQQSPAVDYQAGVEAMVLAILQQTNYSQHAMLATLASLSVLTSQDRAVQDALQLAAYSAYLDDALNANANLTLTVETMLNITSTRSLLPVRQQASTCYKTCVDCLSMNVCCPTAAVRQHQCCVQKCFMEYQYVMLQCIPLQTLCQCASTACCRTLPLCIKAASGCRGSCHGA